MQQQAGLEFLPFARPDISEAEIEEVVSALRSGWWTTGPKTKQFEEMFSQRFGAEALAVNSATSGLHLALEACGIGPGDEVITTTYTFTATGEVVRYLGAHPVLVDIDPVTMNIDVNLIEGAITPHTKAIIPVHIAGLSCDMDPIFDIARRHNLHVIEDAAHAIPSSYKGCEIGSLGSSATVYSFYATKPIATGEGGMVVTKDPDIAARARIMRLHGINRDAFDRYRSATASWRYDVVAPGFKYNMTDLASALGIVQFNRQPEMHAKRQRIAEHYSSQFADLPVLLPAPAPPGDLHSWHLYMIRLTDDAPVDRDAFIAKMGNLGIGTSVHYTPMHMLSYWRNCYELTDDRFPVATEAFHRIVSIPIHSALTDSDVERIVDGVRISLTGRGAS